MMSIPHYAVSGSQIMCTENEVVLVVLAAMPPPPNSPAPEEVHHQVQAYLHLPHPVFQAILKSCMDAAARTYAASMPGSEIRMQ